MLLCTAEGDTAAAHGIHDAVKLGNVHILEAMVKNGASINEHDTTKDHFTPLHWACHVGSLEVRFACAALTFELCCSYY